MGSVGVIVDTVIANGVPAEPPYQLHESPAVPEPLLAIAIANSS
jgi:hypothetical protein